MTIDKANEILYNKIKEENKKLTRSASKRSEIKRFVQEIQKQNNELNKYSSGI